MLRTGLKLPAHVRAGLAGHLWATDYESRIREVMKRKKDLTEDSNLSIQ
jgi:hypothetical protein